MIRFIAKLLPVQFVVAVVLGNKTASLLQAMESDVKAVSMDYVYATAFQGTPLGKSIMGTTSSIKLVIL